MHNFTFQMGSPSSIALTVSLTSGAEVDDDASLSTVSHGTRPPSYALKTSHISANKPATEVENGSVSE